MLTIIPLLEETFALDVVSFLVIFFFAGGFFAALGVTVLLERERVVLAMVAYDLRNRSDVSFQSDIHPRGATEESESVDLDFFDFFHSNTVSVRKYVSYVRTVLSVDVFIFCSLDTSSCRSFISGATWSSEGNSYPLMVKYKK